MIELLLLWAVGMVVAIALVAVLGVLLLLLTGGPRSLCETVRKVWENR